MKRIFLSLALGALLIPSVEARTHNVSISVDDWGEITSCDQISVRFSDSRGYRAEEQLPVASLRSLRLHAAKNGGIYVSGGTAYSVTACKAAEFEEGLRDIRVSLRGNEVGADGPDESTWLVYFLVVVPRNADLNLDSHNGPIAIQNVNGTVTARAINGPISMKQSSGTMDLETENGPISLAGGSGTMRLNAQNGPISVKFDGDTWNGSLEAHTQNGPLSIKVPRDFRSGMVVESDGHGPMSCRAAACREARRTWDEDESRRIEIGSGPTVVRMSTVNGPISVKED